MKKTQMRVPAQQTTPGWGREGRPLILSIKHGYLWIGYSEGPCVMTITGKKTLQRLGHMLLAHAR